ncbi:MAG: TetR/AcrR family transcriptional regulator [Patulibacter sp.]|nr:TetR/AcrR family transcriptional regulator [Patulibacter sp.]
MTPSDAPTNDPAARPDRDPARPDADPARRLLRGVAAAVADKGYAATTIADIVRHAQVSKRTFYEHFPDKQHCYLEAYRRGTEHLARLMVEAGTTATGPWRERLRAAIRGYLGVLVATPDSTRSFTTGIPAAGSEAIAARRAMHRRTAEALIAVVDHVRRDTPELAPLRPLIAEAIVGALSELVLNAVADGRVDDLPTLDEPILELLSAVLTADPDPTEDPQP